MFKKDLFIKRLNENAMIPTRGSKYSAGLDLYANLDKDEITIRSHETVMIPTGIAIHLPKKTFGAIAARSGLATKIGLAPANKLGIIDEDYRGEVIVALHNHSNNAQTIHNQERIAQLIVMPYCPVNCIEVNHLIETERGARGFGSSGK